MKSGYVALIGRANAGKSTLVNVLVGEKVAIVSPKPQTTRDAIMGIITEPDYQIVFIDTPGVYKAKNALSQVMEKTTETTAKGVDLIVFVLDAHDGLKDNDIELARRYQSSKIPMIIAYTKIDIMPRENIPEDIKRLYEEGINCDVYPVSSRKGINLKKLVAAIVDKLPEGDKVIEDDIVSDKSERFMLAEIMREKILLKFDKEIPHGVAVVINTFEKQENGVYDINLD
ncbi:MAG: GTPase Era, partial [Clostridia bacterium]|nr:GTPase Era [Clostridia bacterium]